MGVTSMFCPGNCRGRMRMGSCLGWGFVRAHGWGFARGRHMDIQWGFARASGRGFARASGWSFPGHLDEVLPGHLYGGLQSWDFASFDDRDAGANTATPIYMHLDAQAKPHPCARTKPHPCARAKPHPDAPSRGPGKTPSRCPGKTPSRCPGKTPSRCPGKTPSRCPGKTPSRCPGKPHPGPQAMPGQNLRHDRNPFPFCPGGHTHTTLSPHPLSLFPGQKPGHFSRFLTGIPASIAKYIKCVNV